MVFPYTQLYSLQFQTPTSGLLIRATDNSTQNPKLNAAPVSTR